MTVLGTNIIGFISSTDHFQHMIEFKKCLPARRIGQVMCCEQCKQVYSIYFTRDIPPIVPFAPAIYLVCHFVKMVFTIISKRLLRANVKCCKIIVWAVNWKTFVFFDLVIAVCFYDQSQKNTAHKWRVNNQIQQHFTHSVIPWLGIWDLMLYGLRSSVLSTVSCC